MLKTSVEGSTSSQPVGTTSIPPRARTSKMKPSEWLEEIPLSSRRSCKLRSSAAGAMDIVHERSSLERYMREAIKVTFDSPVLLDRFLDDAVRNGY